MNRRRSRFFDFLELLSTMRFAIALLVVLALASVIGTVIKQQAPYPNYVNQFGPFWAEIFRAFQLDHIYSAAWFLTLLAFLIASLSLCLLRNGAKKISQMRSWKDHLQENNLRAFRHHAQWHIASASAPPIAIDSVCTPLTALIKKHGYRYVIRRQTQEAVLIAAKRGTLSNLGYFLTHLSIIVICLGGLLDSCSFRGVVWVPEGQSVSAAILNKPKRAVIQSLPLTIQLNRFIVDYYSTGMPKRFASDVTVTDHASGQRRTTRIEVNKPLIYAGMAIYQSSFEDGGSTLQFTAYPMMSANVNANTNANANTRPFKLSGQINSVTPLTTVGNGQTIELTDFRSINVENMRDDADASQTASQTAARNKADLSDAHPSNAHRLLNAALKQTSQTLIQHLGSAAKTSKPLHLRNVGPSVQYKIRDKSGQAREFNHYMLPITIDGERVFLAGMRISPDEPFRYLRIPADQNDSVKEWMRLRAALADSTMRAAAARRFAAHAVQQASLLQQPLEESATRLLAIFSGAAGRSVSPAAHGHLKPPAYSNSSDLFDPRYPPAGFAAMTNFINQTVPSTQAQEQARVATLLVRLLDGVVWELWQVARAHADEPPAQINAVNRRFIQLSLNALSDSFYYHSPVFLQLDAFKEVKASVFQVTKTPGKNIVYFGCLLLVFGIITMFYLNERRVWFWLKLNSAGVAPNNAQIDILMAMSSPRITRNFEQAFTELKQSVEQWTVTIKSY